MVGRRGQGGGEAVQHHDQVLVVRLRRRRRRRRFLRRRLPVSVSLLAELSRAAALIALKDR
jgi:hypothetical protein